MQLSQPVQNITDGSDGWELLYKARDMKAAGRDVIELNIGEHDIRTDPLILEAMYQSALAGNTGYAMVPGQADLRKTVADRIQARTGVPTVPENILITPGGQSALFAAHFATLNANDTALYIDPYYATYPGTIRMTGARDHAIAARSEDGFQPDARDIDRIALETSAKTLLINSPNNPTGAVYSEQTMTDVVTTCQDRDLWIISDEVYDTQIWSGTHISPRQLDAERTLVVGSMSKSHAMTGSRLGWVCAPAHVISHLIDVATHTTYGVPGFIQDAALAAFSQGPEFEEKIAEPFRRRMHLALGILERSTHIRVLPPQGGMYLMLDIRATGKSGEEFALGLLETHGIAVMPGESFGAAAAGHIRIAMTTNDKDFAKALEKICAYVDHLCA